MSDDPPFVSVVVRPFYGAGQAVISWQLQADHNSLGVLLYRSLDGTEPWTLLNKDEQPMGGTEFVDDSLPGDTVFNRVTYRLVVEYPDGNISAPRDAGMFETMSVADQRQARAFMVSELRRLRRGAGVPAFLYNEKRDGRITKAYDQVTGRLTNLSVADTTGGVFYHFEAPVQTWVQLVQTEARTARREAGTGEREMVGVRARLPGFPQPVRNTLLVLPASDTRYVVDAEVVPFSFRGLVPVAYQVNLILLPRHDPRYKIKVPVMDPNLVYPSFT